MSASEDIVAHPSSRRPAVDVPEPLAEETDDHPSKILSNAQENHILGKRCEDHEGVEEFIACPRCDLIVGAVANLSAPVARTKGEKQHQQQPSSSLQDEHIMIVGTMQGWDKARTLQGFDEGWEHFALSSSRIQPVLRPIERLIVYLARLWYVYQTTPSEHRDSTMLPAFLHSTPAQTEQEHDEAIDVTPFPIIRQKLVLGSHRYHSDNFWQRFVVDCRFLWPSNVEDAFEYDTNIQQFVFTPLFRQRMYDSDSWALTSDFFDDFPELHGDARKYEAQLITYRNRGILHGADSQHRVRAGTKRRRSRRTLIDEEHEPTSQSTSGRSTQQRSVQDLLEGLFMAIKHNDASVFDDLVTSLRNGDQQAITRHLRQNFEALREQGIEIGEDLNDNSYERAARRAVSLKSWNHSTGSSASQSGPVSQTGGQTKA